MSVHCDGREVPVEYELTAERYLFWRTIAPGRDAPLFGIVSGVMVDSGLLREAAEVSV